MGRDGDLKFLQPGGRVNSQWLISAQNTLMVQGKTANSFVFLYRVVILILMLHIRYPASRMDFTELLENV